MTRVTAESKSRRSGRVQPDLRDAMDARCGWRRPSARLRGESGSTELRARSLERLEAMPWRSEPCVSSSAGALSLTRERLTFEYASRMKSVLSIFFVISTASNGVPTTDTAVSVQLSPSSPT